MTPGRSNIHPEQLDSYYNVSSAQFKMRHLLKFLIFADLGLALAFGRECNPETDFYEGFRRNRRSGSCFLFAVLVMFESVLIKVNRQLTEICIHNILLLIMISNRYI